MTDHAAQQEQVPNLGTWLYDARQNSTAQAGVDSQADSQTPADMNMGMATVGRTAIALVVIIALIVVGMLLLKRFGPYKQLGGRGLKLIAGQSVGPRERVVVMEVEDTWLVLGVTQNNINMLHKLPAQQDTQEAPPSRRRSADRPSFTQAFADNLRQAISRRPRS